MPSQNSAFPAKIMNALKDYMVQVHFQPVMNHPCRSNSHPRGPWIYGSISRSRMAPYPRERRHRECDACKGFLRTQTRRPERLLDIDPRILVGRRIGQISALASVNPNCGDLHSRSIHTSCGGPTRSRCSHSLQRHPIHFLRIAWSRQSV